MKPSEKGDFSKGPVFSTIIKLALPIILAELVQVTYNIVDRIYIGRIPDCGTDALTGMGLVLPFITIINAFANLCSYGGATLSAIARGEKNDKKAQSFMENAFTLLVISGLVLMAIFLIFSKQLVMWLGGDEVTTFYACEYFDIYVLGTVFVLISLGMNSFITMQGYSVIGMWTVLIGAILNIVLDPVFIYVFNMGVKGAAVATVISQACSALWVIIFLRRKDIPLRFTRFRFNGGEIVEILKLGVSGFMFKATNSITQGIVNKTLRIFGGALGSLYIAAMSIIFSVREVVQQPVNGFIEGAKPVLSYNYGAKDYWRVNKTITYMHLASFAYTTFMWALIMLFPETIIGIFSNDPALIEVAIPCLRTFYCVFFFMSLQTAGQNTFVALKHSGYSVTFSLLRKVGLIAPLTLLLPRLGLGVMGVFWAEVASEIIGGSACHLTMYFKVWKPIKQKMKEQQRLTD